MRFFILPYNMGSEGAKALSVELGCRRLFNDARSNYKYRSGDVIINWGNSQINPLYPSRRGRGIQTPPHIINHPTAVAQACNKLIAYSIFKQAGVPSCEYYTSLNQIDPTGLPMIYARKYLSASCGRGIIPFTYGASISYPDAPLYTKYYKAKREYRVHVVDGKIIRYTKKGKRRDREGDPNPFVRNHNNGWVFIEEGIELPECVAEAAIKAVGVLGLDFGAADIGWNGSEEQPCCVYEVNSACGMSLNTKTAEAYGKAFRELLI